MFHQYGDDDVDENKLRHQHEDDEEDRCDDWRDAAVFVTVVHVVTTALAQRVLKHHCMNVTFVVYYAQLQ